MKYSIAVVGTPQRTDSKGFEAVRLRVSFNSQTCFIPAGMRWLAANIQTNGILQGSESLKNFVAAQKVLNDLKLQIESALVDGEILSGNDLKLRLVNKPTLQFYTYCKKKLLERVGKLDIQHSTYRVQLESIDSFNEYARNITFDRINPTLVEGFKVWMKKNGLARNTIWTRLKDIRTYMNIARKEGIKFNYPFGGAVKMPKAQSRLKFLSESDFQSVMNYYYTTQNQYHREVLRAFIFSCYTGLRIGDIKTVLGKCIKGKTLVFEPLKTSKSETKKFIEIQIPLHDWVINNLPARLFKDAAIFHELPAETKINLRLKEVAKAINIEPFSFHWSRHTFATRFLRFGGKLEVLQKLLGHENISTTMIYVHIESSHAENQISLLT